MRWLLIWKHFFRATKLRQFYFFFIETDKSWAEKEDKMRFAKQRTSPFSLKVIGSFFLDNNVNSSTNRFNSNKSNNNNDENNDNDNSTNNNINRNILKTNNNVNSSSNNINNNISRINSCSCNIIKAAARART